MDSSLEMPTATSVRTVPMKLVIDHRTMINAHLARTIGGKVSFTHLIGYAMVRARWALIIVRWSMTSFMGTARTLVAVGISSELSMFFAVLNAVSYTHLR